MAEHMPSRKPIEAWRKTLEELQVFEATTAGAAQKIEVARGIAEAKEKIAELEAQPAQGASSIDKMQGLLGRTIDRGKFNPQAPELFRLESFGQQTNQVVYPWNADDLAKHIRSLVSGTLFISSAHDDVLRQAAQAVAFADKLQGYQVLAVNPDADDTLDLGLLLNQAESIKADGQMNPSEGKVVFVVEATRTLLLKLPDLALRLRNQAGRGIHLLFMVRQQWLDGREATAWHCGMPHWEIDALTLLLETYRGTTTDDELRDLAAQCQRQGNRAHTVRHEVELVAMVDFYLQENGIEGVKLALAEGRLNGRAVATEVTAARNRWAKSGPIEQAALFLAVSFPNLTWESFEYLMPALLAEKTEMVVKTTSVPPTKDIPNPALCAETVSVPALTRWLETAHSLLADVGLCCVEGSGADMVQFIEPMQEAALREALAFQANISLDMYDALHKHGIYFDPNTPTATVVALASATCRLVSRAGQRYNEQWLHRRVRDIQRWVGRNEAEEAQSIDAGSLEQLFRSLIRAEKNGRNLESLFFSRLCDLCSEFLSEPKAAPIVDRFIQLMVQDPQTTGHHILQIVRRLKGHEAFEHLRWIKHLFDCGDTATCQAALQLLFSEQSEPRRFWTVCLEIAAWLPDYGEPIKHQCQRWALAFLPLWFLDTVQRSRAMLRRDPASRIELPLFAEAADLPLLAERLQTASKLIGHPLFPEATVWALKKVQTEDAALPSGG
ncbi:MAG: hypothetical protein WAO00_10185, partial [Chthoniobacterales bacterium]